MVHFSLRSLRNKRSILFWCGLAFQAGAINAGGFLASRSFVSHVTGIGTMIGIKVAEHRLYAAAELLIVPLSFLCGAAYSALIIDRRRALKKPPHFILAMATIWLLVSIIFVTGSLGHLGQFGEDLVDYRDLIVISALCFACGLQNASIVSSTHGAIRTTHLTGIVTDFGINLVRIPYIRKYSKERYREILVNRIRLGTFCSFSFGSALSASLFLKHQYLGFIVPFTTSTLFLFIAFQASRSSRSKLEVF